MTARAQDLHPELAELADERRTARVIGITAAVTRISSLAGLTASFIAALVPWWFGDTATSLALLVLVVVSYIKHHANIGRLLRGTEPKIGAKG